MPNVLMVKLVSPLRKFPEIVSTTATQNCAEDEMFRASLRFAAFSVNGQPIPAVGVVKGIMTGIQAMFTTGTGATCMSVVIVARDAHVPAKVWSTEQHDSSRLRTKRNSTAEEFRHRHASRSVCIPARVIWFDLDLCFAT